MKTMKSCKELNAPASVNPLTYGDVVGQVWLTNDGTVGMFIDFPDGVRFINFTYKTYGSLVQRNQVVFDCGFFSRELPNAVVVTNE